MIKLIMAIGAWLLLLMVLGFAQDVLAHDADKPCPPGVTVSFGCQVPAEHLGLLDPEFFALNKKYWHCRRELEGTLKAYAYVLGVIHATEAKKGYALFPPAAGCLNYHEIIPATPIIERPSDYENARAQIEACEANTCGKLLQHAQEHLNLIW